MLTSTIFENCPQETKIVGMESIDFGGMCQ